MNVKLARKRQESKIFLVNLRKKRKDKWKGKIANGGRGLECRVSKEMGKEKIKRRKSIKCEKRNVVRYFVRNVTSTKNILEVK